MSGTRVAKLAEVLIDYSLNIKPGDRLAILAPVPAIPLAREVYRAALRAGGHPVARITVGNNPGAFAFDGMTELLLREGSDQQVGFADLDLLEVERYDALLAIWADEDTQALSSIAPQRLAQLQQTRGPVMARLMERWSAGELRWCVTLSPTEAHARDAGMSSADYEDFVYGAGLLDAPDPARAWREMCAELQHIAAWLGRHHEIHVVAPGTDLTYRVGGRRWIDASGINNFPDGEVFTSPIENSVSGTIRFSYPAVYAGTPVEDVRLTFREGRVVEATATRGQEFLDAMLAQDEGARYVGEVAFGMNYGITRWTRNILFDEKLGGTIHLALGMSFPNAGGQNQSSLHWDMITNMGAGEVYADGQLCYRNGRFVI